MASASGLTSSGVGYVASVFGDFEVRNRSESPIVPTPCCAPRKPHSQSEAGLGQKFQWEGLESQSDEKLMQLVTLGNRDALGTLFCRYRRLVHTIAIRIVHDTAEAEEVVQTVFLDMYRAASRFDPAKGALKVWMLQYAYHRAFHRKRHLVAARFYDTEALENARPDSMRSHLVVRLSESLFLAKQMLRALNPKQRVVVELFYFEGLTAQEISNRLRQSVHVVRHDLRRGLSQMKTWYRSGACGTPERDSKCKADRRK